MYHCHLCIYLTGHWNNTFKIIREMLPLGAFKHEFLESDRPKPELASKADLILAGFEDLDIDLREALADLASGKNRKVGIETVCNRHLWRYLALAMAILVLFMALPQIVTFLPEHAVSLVDN